MSKPTATDPMYSGIYIGKEHVKMWKELHALGDKCGVSMNRLVLIALAVCAPDFKKNLPTKRTFIIEKAEVVV